MRESFVDKFLADKKLLDILVVNLCTLVLAARQLRQQNPQAELPGEGCWTYGQVVHEYTLLLKLLATNSNLYFDPSHAMKLWQCLVANPVTAQELSDGTGFFRAGINGSSTGSNLSSTPFIEDTAMKPLLVKHITHMDAAQMTHTLFQCFSESFRAVGCGVCC